MEQIAGVLEKLATKLGITVEYLWTVLVRQAYMEGIVYLVWFFVLILFSLIGIPKSIKWVKGLPQDETFGYDVQYIFAMVGLAVLFAIVIFSIPSMFSDGIQRLLNPEYFALEKILNVLK